MFLSQQEKYNQLSDELRKELEKKIDSFGKTVTYKFDISHPDPHPDNRGKPVWPSRWTLGPVTFQVRDPHETNGQKMKSIGLVQRISSDNDKRNGENDRFERIRLTEANRGLLVLNLELEEDRHKAMYVEMHPKLKEGMFADTTKKQVIERIDEKRFSTEKRAERTEKLKALNVAQEMSEVEVRQFADAMLWDSTEDEVILRGKVEDLAEASPKFFNDLVSGKNIEYQAAVKKAMDKKLIAFDPAENKFIWCDNNQIVTRLQLSTDKNEVESMAEWLLTGGDSAKKVYEKLKSLIKV